MSVRHRSYSLLFAALLGTVTAGRAQEAQPPAAPASPAPATPAPATPAPATPAPGAPAAPGEGGAGAGDGSPRVRGPVPPAPPEAPRTPGELPAPEVRILSIDDAVRTALLRNPSLEQSLAAIRRAEAVVAETRSFRQPRLDGGGTLTTQGPIASFTTVREPTTPGGAPVRQTIALGREFQRSVNITGSYSLDPFGRLRAATRVATQQVNVQRGGLYQTQNELVFAVQNIYLASLRGRALINVAREAVEAAQEQLRVARAQVRAGTAPEFDVIRAEVQVANLRQDIVASEATYRRAVLNLQSLLSLEPTTRVELVNLTLPPEPDAVAIGTARGVLEPEAGSLLPDADRPLVPRSIEAALSEAFNQRPELYTAEWQRRVAQAQVRLQRKGLTPDVNLAGSFFYNPDQTGFAPITESWSIIANIAIPIWDGGLTRARVRQARADLDSAKAQIQAARDEVTEDVKRALVNLEEALERRRATAANVAQAREALRIARVRYTAGLAPNVEVTDAQVALTQAQTNEVNAAYDYLAALADLNRALGRYAGDTLEMMLG